MRFALSLSLKDLRRIFPAADFGISCIKITPPLKRLCGATFSEINKIKILLLTAIQKEENVSAGNNAIRDELQGNFIGN